MANPNNKTILIADDEAYYVSLLRTQFEKEGYSVIWVQSAAEAMAKVSIRPIAVIVDLMRGQAAGLELCRKLRAFPEWRHLPIIVFTSKHEEADEVVSLEVGADDFVHKSATPRVLLARLRNVLKRCAAPPLPADLNQIKIGPLEIDRTTYTVRLNGKEVFLPRKEFELLWVLASNKGKVFSREMLLRSVWGESVYVTDRTVDVHICKIRQRLGTFGTEHLETIKGVGYRIKA